MSEEDKLIEELKASMIQQGIKDLIKGEQK